MITKIVKKNKKALGLILFFILVENIAWIIEPTFFGKLLDAMIERFRENKDVNYIWPLVIWIVFYLINVLGGALSRLLSGKEYARIYAEVASDVILKSQKKRHSMSKILARAELAKEYIVFLKDRVPEILWQLSAAVGGIIALFFYDWRIAAVCLMVVLPMFFINKIYHKHVKQLQKSIHDTREEMYQVLDSKDSSTITQYYHSMVEPQAKIAQWSSSNYSIVKVLLMIVFIIVLFMCIDVDEFTTGKIYSIVSYLWTFIASTEYLPGLMESFASVRDLSSRMSEEVEVIIENKELKA